MEILIIILLSFIAATISGVAGFGGGLILLPLLTYFISPKLAIPLLTIAQLFGNGSRVFLNIKHLQWKSVILFLVGAIPFTIIGSSLLASIDPKGIEIAIGVFLIAVVVYKRFNQKDFKMNPYLLIPGGAATGFISGLIGSAGPLGASLFLSLKLPALSYISSEAFTAMSMHVIKIFIYSKYELLTWSSATTGFIAGLAMVAGTYTGKVILTKVPPKWIDLFIEIMLLVSAVQLII